MGDDQPSPSGTSSSACEEGREALQRQIDTISDIDNKAVRIFRANILFLTIIVTGLSVAVKADTDLYRFINTSSVTGVIYLLGSIAAAGITYAGTSIEVGIGHKSLSKYVQEDYSEEEHYGMLLRGYANWLHYNDTVIQLNGFLNTLTIMFSINAIAYLTAGAMIGISQTNLLGEIILLTLVSVGVIIADYIAYVFDSLISAQHLKDRPHKPISDS